MDRSLCIYLGYVPPCEDMNMIDHSTIDNLDQLSPLERAELICPEIRAMGNDAGLVDAIFGDGDQWAADLIAEIAMHQCMGQHYADSQIYPTLLVRAQRKLAEAITRRVLNVVEDTINEHLEQLHEDAQPGMTVEQEDRLLRARDMIEEWA
jgi:hypothetical protein